MMAATERRHRMTMRPTRRTCTVLMAGLLAACALGALAAPGAASDAASDAATTEAAVKLATSVCASCHGLQGAGDNPRIPRLAGQQRAYIEVQLKAFRSQLRGDRAAHETMWTVAATLDDQIVAALAEYFANQPPAPGITSGNRQVAARGKDLYEKGSPERGLPACASCHGANAEGLAVFPRLAGQHGEYLFVQLQSIRNKLRVSPVMDGLIKELTDDEVVALATYLESK
jgi:cytochrome c553